MRIFLYLILVLVVAVAVGWLVYWQTVTTPVAESGQDITFRIEPGEGVKKIGRNLEKVGLIDSSFFFETYVWHKQAGSELQAGTYRLNPSQSIREMVRVMQSGETVNQEITIRIIEGWDNRDIAKYLEDKRISQPGEFTALADHPISDWQFGFSRPGFLASVPGKAGLEGFLFPDTYRVYNDADTADVVEKMLNNFGRKLTPELEQAVSESSHSLFDITTMASIVEKEVRSAEDMRKVAGIFWQRISNGQPLESCATLAYILGKDKPQYSQADTEIESPYNTYQYSGLPPGPISNPGLQAIRAAVNPEMTGYNYFLSRPDTGETVFSRTYEEHLQNKAKYLDSDLK